MVYELKTSTDLAETIIDYADYADDLALHNNTSVQVIHVHTHLDIYKCQPTYALIHRHICTQMNTHIPTYTYTYSPTYPQLLSKTDLQTNQAESIGFRWLTEVQQ